LYNLVGKARSLPLDLRPIGALLRRGFKICMQMLD
jgi:hypothetical protein